MYTKQLLKASQMYDLDVILESPRYRLTCQRVQFSDTVPYDSESRVSVSWRVGQLNHRTTEQESNRSAATT